MKNTHHNVTAFLKNENGSATVEAVIWLPMLLFVFMMIVNVAFVFNGKGQVFQAVQDANRAFSVGRLASAQATQTAIKAAIKNLSSHATVTTTLTDGIITSNVLIPVSDLTAVGQFDFLTGYNVQVRAQHFMEY